MQNGTNQPQPQQQQQNNWPMHMNFQNQNNSDGFSHQPSSQLKTGGKIYNFFLLIKLNLIIFYVTNQ